MHLTPGSTPSPCTLQPTKTHDVMQVHFHGEAVLALQWCLLCWTLFVKLMKKYHKCVAGHTVNHTV